MKIGADYQVNGTGSFVVWAPARARMTLRLVSPAARRVLMEQTHNGYWQAIVPDLPEEAQYFYTLNGDRDRPDPASHFQPGDVHGPSQIVNHHRFEWRDQAWKGLNLAEMIIYELHVGAFTPSGTFDAIIPRLADLKALGVNTIELMPVAQFPGTRNWGYDGVFPFAVQNSYGGPTALKRLVNACHQTGLAVVLDVVYNHLGPEGNYLWDYGPYFTDRYRTPWGDAVNFDGAESDEVRNFFFENARHWFENYHCDGLRLDAVHAICDRSATPFLLELADRMQALSQTLQRPCYLIAESDLNDSRLIAPPALGGFGLDAVWCDDFHHALHALATGERHGYYVDFGAVEHLAKAMREGFVYAGEYSAFRRHRHGSSSKDRPGHQFLVFSQNHDQVGNRMLGERMSLLVDFERLKVGAGLVLLSPYVPLLFMGEEYGEEAPFLYFVDHADQDLIQAIRAGRAEEFAAFQWQGEPPDPSSLETFRQSKLHWEARGAGWQAVLLSFYGALIGLRKAIPCLSSLDKTAMDVRGWEDQKALLVRRWDREGATQALCLCTLKEEPVVLEISDHVPDHHWKKVLDSADAVWNGPGALLTEVLDPGRPVTLPARSLAVYLAEGNS